MINTNLLDKRQTYVCLEYGTGAISKIIIDLTKVYCPEATRVPSHVFALVYELGNWYVYESHMRGNKKPNIPSGCRRYDINMLQDVFPKVWEQSEVYKVRLTKKTLRNLLGEPYGAGDIYEIFKARLKKKFARKDRNGFICSEYLARACYKIQRHFNLAANQITPAHWLKYMIDNSIERIS